MFNDLMDTIGFVTGKDPEVGQAMEKEFARQRRNLELIASENIVSPAVMAAMGTVLTNKYAEGYPGKRYYGGCQCVDIVEDIARDRACKLIGSAQRVPVPTGSTTILVAVVKGKDITKEGINAAMKAASSESFGYTEEPLVSSDIIGITYGSLFDATQTMVAKIDDDTYQVQVVSWYDNENSYTSQMVRTIKYFAEI